MYRTSIYDHDMEYDYVLSRNLDQQTSINYCKLNVTDIIVWSTCIALTFAF